MSEKIKIQYIKGIPPLEKRKPDLFYYDIRDSEIDDGFTIERGVLANNIGSIVTNKDILGKKKFITDEEFYKLELEQVTNLYIKENTMETNMEMEV